MAEKKQRLTILQVNTADAGGGAESSAYNLFRAFTELGHNSWLAVGYKYLSDSQVVNITDEAMPYLWSRFCFTLRRGLNYSCKALRGIGRLKSGLRTISNVSILIDKYKGIEDFNFPATYRLLDLIPCNPDIIHCHNLHGGYFDLRALPWFSNHAPVILNLRDAWLLSGHCAHSLECERWKIGCGCCPDLSLYPAIRRDNTAVNWKRKQSIYQQSRLYVTASSQWLMGKVKDSMLQAVKYKVIPNAIDTSVFVPGDKLQARAQLGLPFDTKIILFVANFARRNIWKDYATMEKAVKQVVTDNPKLNIIFVCIGEKSAGKNNSCINFVKFEADAKRLAKYYQSADIYIHAARAESFGKTITEAMACGVPVVATNVGGISEQIKDGQTGFLVPYQDSMAMAKAIEKLLYNPALAAGMGALAAKDAAVRFSLEKQAKSFLDWYQEIITDWKIFKNTIKNE